jgi:phosphotransacetylase
MDVPALDQAPIITDAAVNIFPTLQDKVDIIQNAIDLTAAQIKKIDSPVAGQADILVVPDLEAGVASTMGFTALDGLPMGTRCGAIDPGVLLYLMDERREELMIARHTSRLLP